MKIHYSNSSARQLLLSQGCTRVVLALALGGLQHSCSAHQVCREVHANYVEIKATKFVLAHGLY